MEVPTSIEALKERAKELEGKRLKDIAADQDLKIGERTTAKGVIGRFYEDYFGLEASSRAGPDFEELGVELKTVPIRQGATKKLVKERTKICSLNYGKIVDQKWKSSHAWDKIQHILYVFYQYEKETPKDEWRTLKTYLFEPDATTAHILRDDWETIKGYVERGEAHKLSSRHTDFLEACTAGRGRKVDQPNADEKAKERAIALKPSFTRQIWEEVWNQKEFESVLENLPSKKDDFVDKAFEHFDQFVGKRIAEVAEELNIETGGKHYKAKIARKALGAQRENTGLREFERAGIEIKTVPIRYTTNRPIEATSFPKFDFFELADSSWEQSDLKEYLQRICFIPLLGNKDVNHADYVMDSPFMWSPSENEEQIIRKEWEMYRDLVADGKADDLPSSTDTEIIHVRPKGRDSDDTLEAPGGIEETKKGFWLNTGFVKQLYEESNHLQNSERFFE